MDTQSELRKAEFRGIYRINRIRKSKHLTFDLAREDQE
jgi:hypothetical protein